MTEQQLNCTAAVINEVFTPDMIRSMYRLPGGDEILRRIVRDNLAGTADKIAAALWDM